MGLCAFDDPDRPSLRRGIEYLIRTQNPDGSWTEHETTGTGFPKVFYLKYDIYRNSWPLLALATYRNVQAQAGAKRDGDGDGELRRLAERPEGLGERILDVFSSIRRPNPKPDPLRQRDGVERNHRPKEGRSAKPDG